MGNVHRVEGRQTAVLDSSDPEPSGFRSRCERDRQVSVRGHRMKFPSGRSALRIPHSRCPNSSPSPAQHHMQPSPLNVVGEGPVPSRGSNPCRSNSTCGYPGHGRAQGTPAPTHTRRGSPLPRVGIPMLTALMMLALLAEIRPDSASAHPLGNFTVNQYARIEVTADGPRIVYVLDMAEVPAFQEIKAIDASGDGEIDDGERAAYLDLMVGTIGRALELTVDGQLLALRAEDASLAFPDGQAGLQLIRLRAVFVPAATLLLTGGDQMVTFVNTYQTDRLGWREIIVTHDEDVTVSGIELPESDTSRELTAYPDDLLASPLDQTEAS